MAEEQGRRRRPVLTRSEQRYNYALAIAAVAIVVILVVVSPAVTFDGQSVPVLVVALLAGAFLFGLGQMVAGISRRRAYLRTLRGTGEPGEGSV
ncbi:MAG: hypothetical protein ABR573_01890 [Candidatus Dormibacteria bacterium]